MRKSVYIQRKPTHINVVVEKGVMISLGAERKTIASRGLEPRISGDYRRRLDH